MEKVTKIVKFANFQLKIKFLPVLTTYVETKMYLQLCRYVRDSEFW
jgi:hypothetical protein